MTIEQVLLLVLLFGVLTLPAWFSKVEALERRRQRKAENRKNRNSTAFTRNHFMIKPFNPDILKEYLKVSGLGKFGTEGFNGRIRVGRRAIVSKFDWRDVGVYDRFGRGSGNELMHAGAILLITDVDKEARIVTVTYLTAVEGGTRMRNGRSLKMSFDEFRSSTADFLEQWDLDQALRAAAEIIVGQRIFGQIYQAPEWEWVKLAHFPGDFVDDFGFDFRAAKGIGPGIRANANREAYIYRGSFGELNLFEYLSKCPRGGTEMPDGAYFWR